MKGKNNFIRCFKKGKVFDELKKPYQETFNNYFTLIKLYFNNCKKIILKCLLFDLFIYLFTYYYIYIYILWHKSYNIIF